MNGKGTGLSENLNEVELNSLDRASGANLDEFDDVDFGASFRGRRNSARRQID
jgi:hypothetical protein